MGLVANLTCQQTFAGKDKIKSNNNQLLKK